MNAAGVFTLCGLAGGVLACLIAHAIAVRLERQIADTRTNPS